MKGTSQWQPERRNAYLIGARPRRRGAGGPVSVKEMPLVGRIGKVTLHMFANDHGPDPHVHPRYNRRFSKVSIVSGEILGTTNLTVRQLRSVRRWIREHEDRLLDQWLALRREQRERERT